MRTSKPVYKLSICGICEFVSVCDKELKKKSFILPRNPPFYAHQVTQPVEWLFTHSDPFTILFDKMIPNKALGACSYDSRTIG